MPSYSFVCKHCGWTDDVTRPMDESDRPYICTCGRKMSRDIVADVPFVSGGEYRRAIHSDSLAISPDQRAAHEKQFPNIKLDSECRPIFDNFKDHNAYLKATGFKKERQRIKHRKTKKLPTSKVTKCVAK
jgi:putative FmdB family regulatory protein